MKARSWQVELVLLGALGCACNVPPPQYALTVRDPDKLCRLIAFSQCPRQEVPDADGGSDSDAGTDDDLDSR